jgi:hypothetical protein
MERERVECNPREIVQYAQRLAASVNGTPAAVVFHLDESGFQDWVNLRNSKVVVPSGFRDHSIMIPVERNVNQNWLLVCITADGTYLRPLLIVPRKTIDQELVEQDITSAICKMVHQEYGFITTSTFDEWWWEFSSRSLPTVESNSDTKAKQSSSWMAWHAIDQISLRIFVSRTIALLKSCPQIQAIRFNHVISESSG